MTFDNERGASIIDISQTHLFYTDEAKNFIHSQRTARNELYVEHDIERRHLRIAIII